MSVVNTETGEIVETIGAERARRLTTEAQNEFSSSRDHFDQGWAKIEEAVTGGGHLDLGYRSPGDYLHAEFDGALAGLDIASRRIAVKTMTAWGLSTRAVAAPLAISEGTVRNDLQLRNATHLPAIATPDVEDGGTAERPSNEAPAVVHPEGESSPPAAATPAADEGEPEASPARPPVVGIDGKNYPRSTPAPRSTPRRAITDQFFAAAYDLSKVTERIDRLVEDDRFPQNAEKVGAKHRTDLLRAVELLSKALDRLSN